MIHHWKSSSAAGIVCAAFLVLPALAFAVSDDFTVTQSIVAPDNEPPTTPTNLSATPVASTQIDVDWDASSDNVAVGGYQVFRDTVQIATTSLTSYSDTGLTASTTYSYNVTAFDTSFNYSTTSATTSTTTLPVPPPPPPATTSTSTGPTTATQLLFIKNLSYDADARSIDISFDTTRYARATVRWGRTASYEGGFTSSDIYRREHQSTIDGLAPGTVYEVEVVAVDQTLRYERREHFTVTTAAGPDSVPPTNATDFTAALAGGGVNLSWSNPADADFSHVRILSSDRFYPTHPADGWLVYEGSAEDARDDRALAEGARRYYTIFTYDRTGNTSSGVVTSVTRGVYTPPSPPPIETPDVSPETPPGATSSPSTSTAPDLQHFSFDDLVFVQDEEERPSFGGEVVLDADENTLVSLSYELVPEHLKTIVVTLEHPEAAGRAFSFLLRINPDKTAYEAHIGPLREAGVYQTNVALFDYATKELFTVDGVIVVERSPVAAALDTKRVQSLGAMLSGYRMSLVLGGAALVLLFFFFLLRRRRRREKMFVPGSVR